MPGVSPLPPFGRQEMKRRASSLFASVVQRSFFSVSLAVLAPRPLKWPRARDVDGGPIARAEGTAESLETLASLARLDRSIFPGPLPGPVWPIAVAHRVRQRTMRRPSKASRQNRRAAAERSVSGHATVAGVASALRRQATNKIHPSAVRRGWCSRRPVCCAALSLTTAPCGPSAPPPTPPRPSQVPIGPSRRALSPPAPLPL